MHCAGTRGKATTGGKNDGCNREGVRRTQYRGIVPSSDAWKRENFEATCITSVLTWG
jgi:hypothetical protein